MDESENPPIKRPVRYLAAVFGGGVLSEKMIRWQEGVDRGGC